MKDTGSGPAQTPDYLNVGNDACTITVADQHPEGHLNTARVLTDISMISAKTRKIKISWNDYDLHETLDEFVSEIGNLLNRPVNEAKPDVTSANSETGVIFRETDENGVNTVGSKNYAYSKEWWLEPLSMTPEQVIAALRQRKTSRGA